MNEIIKAFKTREDVTYAGFKWIMLFNFLSFFSFYTVFFLYFLVSHTNSCSCILS